MLNSGACSRDGRIHVGDRLVAVEGHDLRALSHAQCVHLLREHSSKGEVTLHLLRQSKQDDFETASDKHVPHSGSGSDVNDSVLGGDGAHISSSDNADDSVANQEIASEYVAEHSQVHHNQIFAQQHVKLAYARNSFRAKKEQMPKIPTDEHFNRGNKNEFSGNDTPAQSDEGAVDDVTDNFSDTEHDKSRALSKHTTVSNLNELETLGSQQLQSVKGATGGETVDTDSIGAESGDRLTEDQRTPSGDAEEASKRLDGSSYTDTSDLYVSSESDRTGGETSSNVQSDITDVTITRAEKDFPNGHQRFGFTQQRAGGADNMESKWQESVADTVPSAVQEILARTPPTGVGILSGSPPGEPPPPPPEFSTDDDDDEPPALPSEGPPSILPPPVPTSLDPAFIPDDGVAQHEGQSQKEVAKSLNPRMQFLDAILNDDSLPVTNIDDLIDDSNTLCNDSVDSGDGTEQPNRHETQVEDFVSFEDSGATSADASVDLKQALIIPFEQLERDLDSDAGGASEGRGQSSSEVTVEGWNVAAWSGPTDHGGNGVAAISGDGQSRREIASSLLVGLDGSEHELKVDGGLEPSGARHVQQHESMAAQQDPAHAPECSAASPRVPASLEQAQSSYPHLHANSHFDLQLKAPSGDQHNSSVSSSHAGDSDSATLTDLKHSFVGSADPIAENVTVVRITSTSLEYLRPSAAQSDNETQHKPGASDTSFSEPPPLPTTHAPGGGEGLVEALTDTTSVSAVHHHEDQDPAERVDDDRESTATADTMSTNISLPQAPDTIESNYTTFDSARIYHFSGNLPKHQREKEQTNSEETVHLHTTTIALGDPAPPRLANYSSHPSTSSSGDALHSEARDSDRAPHGETLSNTNMNAFEPEAIDRKVQSEIQGTCWTSPDIESSETAVQNFLSLEATALESVGQKERAAKGNSQLAVEVSFTEKSALHSEHENTQEVNSDPAGIHHDSRLPVTLKTTGDSEGVNAHRNGNDVLASHSNGPTSDNNQTVTDSSTSHESSRGPTKTSLECERDDTSKEHVNPSSVNDVHFDLSSSGQGSNSFESGSQDSANSTADKEQLLSGDDTLKPASVAVQSESSAPMNSNRDTTSSPKGALPSLTLPKLSSFEARKLTPASSRSTNLATGVTFFKSSPSKVRNRRSEEEPFSVEVLKGLLGLGVKLRVTSDGLAQVEDVQKTGPVGRTAAIR